MNQNSTIGGGERFKNPYGCGLKKTEPDGALGVYFVVRTLRVRTCLHTECAGCYSLAERLCVWPVFPRVGMMRQ